MTDLEKIEFLLKVLKENEIKLNVDGAVSLVTSYKWLLEKREEEQKK